MISQFQHLAEKINQLAELARALRRENAELRVHNAAVTAENVELAKRMHEAHQRVTALLDKIPLSEQDEEAA